MWIDGGAAAGGVLQPLEGPASGLSGEDMFKEPSACRRRVETRETPTETSGESGGEARSAAEKTGGLGTRLGKRRSAIELADNRPYRGHLAIYFSKHPGEKKLRAPPPPPPTPFEF